MNAEYISTTDTAKLIRALLKKKFPGIKFSVRSDKYAGGSSIDVSWTDGPLASQVDEVVKPFAGSGFDGMIDLKYSKSAWLLPDGSAQVAKCEGTAGSRGSVDSFQTMPPSFKAKLVRFSVDYVFTKREYSAALYKRAVEKVCDKYGVPVPEILSGQFFNSIKPDPYVEKGDAWLSTLVYRECAKRTNYILPAASIKEAA